MSTVKHMEETLIKTAEELMSSKKLNIRLMDTLHSRQSVLFVLLCLISSFSCLSTVSAEEKTPILIPMYTYHTHAPFILQEKEGLSYDLADYLTKKSSGQYEFVVKSMSRPRVNKMTEEGEAGIVPWVNPVWFKDAMEKKHLWSRGVLMEDANALVSHQDAKIVYDGPESLNGMVFGGVRSHVYAEIDDYIKHTGRIKRVDAENHLDNFRKLVKHRIDATITPKSGAEFIIKAENLQGELFLSPKPHSTYKRRVIVIEERTGLLPFIETTIAMMSTDIEWERIMKKYR